MAFDAFPPDHSSRYVREAAARAALMPAILQALRAVYRAEPEPTDLRAACAALVACHGDVEIALQSRWDGVASLSGWHTLASYSAALAEIADPSKLIVSLTERMEDADAASKAADDVYTVESERAERCRVSDPQLAADIAAEARRSLQIAAEHNMRARRIEAQISAVRRRNSIQEGA